MLSKFLLNKKTFFIAIFVFILFLTGWQIIKIHQTQAVFCLPGEVEVDKDCGGDDLIPAKCCPSDQPKYSDNHCVAECPGGDTCPSGEVEVIQNCDGDTLTPSRCCPEDLPFYNDGNCVSVCPSYEYGNNNAVVPICAGTPPHYDNQCDDHKSVCESYNKPNGDPLIYTSNGYVKVDAPEQTYGHAKCCGDDSYEWLISCEKKEDIAWTTCGDSACCPYEYLSCVKGGKCYSRGRAHGGLNPGNDDNYAYCSKVLLEMKWSDCDGNYDESGCNCGSSGGVKAGHSNPYPGEYTNLTTKECCGDDKNEVYNPDDGKCYYSSSHFPSLDETPPVTTAVGTSPPGSSSYTYNTWTNQNVGNQLTCDDGSGSGCDITQYCTDTNNTCTPSTTYSSRVDVTTSGTSYIRYRSTDDSENTETTKSKTIKIDKIAPNISTFTVNGHSSNFETQDTSLRINYSVTDNSGGSGLNRVEVWRRTDSGSWSRVYVDTNASGSSHSSSWTDSNSAGHTYEYGLKVYDNAGNGKDEDSTITATVTVLGCDSDDDCPATTCPADGCYGDYKWDNYPVSVPNTCEGGTCTSNSCSKLTQICDIENCGAECEINNCSTEQCHAGMFYQTRATTCQSNCTCLSWSAYASCETSYNECSVECYTGANCNTATNVCACESGYESDGSGGCQESEEGGEGEEENNPPDEPINLAQFDDQRQLDEQDTTNDTTPYFTFTISDPDDGDTVGYQIQIDSDSAFNPPDLDYTWDGSTTNPNDVTYQVPGGSEFVDNTNYRWRVRAKDQDDAYSDWVYFGGDDSPNDFTVDTDYTYPIADFSFCKQEGTQVVQFTNESTDEDGDTLSYSWDFDSRDGIQEDSTAENPTHDYEGVVLGKSNTQHFGSSIPQPHEIVEQAGKNFFEKFYLTNR